MTENEISRIIVECVIEVHRTLGGPGLLESVYEEALVWELQQHGLSVECKATTQYNDIFEAQLLTYLRLSDRKLGLIINFGERLVKHGIHRVVNGL